MSSDFEKSKAVAVLSGYLVVSVRVLAYCTGLFFFATITPYLNSILPNVFLTTILLFGLSAFEYEIIHRIVAKRHKVTFDTTKMAAVDVEYRNSAEKLIKELAYFFVLDLALAILVYAVGGLPEWYQAFILIGFFGSVAAYAHFLGSALLIAAFHPVNKPSVNRSGGLVLVALLFMLPGFAYAYFALYSFLHHFENLRILLGV